MALRETAFAKINLALHVRGRRGDGYHELETLFAFVNDGDRLSARVSEQDELKTFGEFAPELTDPFGNIVSQALGALPRADGLAIDLEKRLPVAAGLGGGSADAGAVFRLVREAYGLPDGWQARAAKLGADVPACVESVACIGRGTGTELTPVENDMAGFSVLLVNPRISVPTGPIFAKWNGTDSGPLIGETVWEIADCNGNDLQELAIYSNSEIMTVLNALSETDYLIRRMSGSGATCFAIYRSHDVMREASEKLASDHPDWWMMQGSLR
ncbi:4-(cytidine 5'-diphospho)-2-C-methyl-D-erythritol kinase [Altererythrobacter sp. ZODW24]|uniref:4-(cytidine 5'-diphospho)-2-C-methyl-D-erythritol kinase n=1 Tax=Altererythrobacter sp. ZODW24 TaxID=2185142 RepID=UPI000DF7A6BE|nr:4-(cytidine 5'-diphospho)-2-C-methyl-D-erythritol kinase [Altererythrobacter sp. ZODW24]